MIIKAIEINNLFKQAILTLLFFLLGFLSQSIWAENRDSIFYKTPTILADPLTSNDPLGYAKYHSIDVRDGRIRIIMEVGERFIREDIASKYALAEFRQRGRIVTASVLIENLRNLCGEPSVQSV